MVVVRVCACTYCSAGETLSIVGDDGAPTDGWGTVSNHDELMSNFFAQADALALGKTAEECEVTFIYSFTRSNYHHLPSLTRLRTLGR